MFATCQAFRFGGANLNLAWSRLDLHEGQALSIRIIVNPSVKDSLVPSSVLASFLAPNYCFSVALVPPVELGGGPTMEESPD